MATLPKKSGDVIPSVVKESSVTEKVVDAASRIGDTGLAVAGAAPMVTPVIAGAVGGVAKVSEKIGLPSIARAATNGKMTIDKWTQLSVKQVYDKIKGGNPERNAALAEQALKKTLDEIGNGLNKAGGVIGAKNAGETVKGLRGAIGKAPVLIGVMNASFIVASAVGMVSAANNLRKNLSSLKEMSKDITGKESSTFSILFGKVPAPIKEARSKLLKNFAVSEVAGAASLGVNIVSTVKNLPPIRGMIAFTAPQLIGGGLNAMIGESSLSIYTALSQAHASGQKISGEAYAALIGTASPELKKRGGADSIFAKELGKIYAEENASPAQVMRRAVNGELMKDLNALIAANEAAKATATVAAPAAVATGSHVAALQKPANKAVTIEQKPVVGNHTAQLVANAGQATHALNVGA
ncbi:MAG: hypothetical protein ABL867_06435 [Rickettsiales bacterium]